MYPYLKIGFLILAIFIIGIIVGVYYHPLIHAVMEKHWNKIAQEPMTEVLHFCPPSKIVKEHQYDPEVFQVEKLYWQIDYQGWKAPENIGFMQVLINENQNLVCYYRWRNPENEGAYLWMTIQLSPEVNQEVKPYGPHWAVKKEEKQALCNAGINACSFILSESTKRIVSQK